MFQWLIAFFVIALLAGAGTFLFLRRKGQAQAALPAEPFIIKPYLQLGDAPAAASAESVELAWHSAIDSGQWSVEYTTDGASWLKAQPAERKFVKLPATPSFRWTALLRDLIPGRQFSYRLLLDGKEVFRAAAKPRVPEGADFRFVCFGDTGEGSPASRQIASQVASANPDVVVLAGDLTYKRGRLSEYQTNFFPVFNADTASPASGAPLLRSRIFVAAAGNHDMGIMDVGDVPNVDRFPDLLGYYIFWSLPLNGPLGRDAKKSVPFFEGSESAKKALYDAAGARFPRMSNYSFDFGDTHWLMLDANWYMNWSDPYLQAWVERDLAAAAGKRWKFVCFHQPAFTTDIKHADEQQMRLLAPLFEKYGVDVVFSGHNHTYERCYPLRFTCKPQPDGSPIDKDGRVDGSFELDREFDGRTRTAKRGVLYLVTGGGGAKLYLTPERRANHAALPPYTYKLVDDLHSFTVCDVSRDKLAFRQVSAEGKELDGFVITK